MSSPLVDAALFRDEQARASFASLQALAFISPEDLARELLALTRHRLALTQAPPLNPNPNPNPPNPLIGGLGADLTDYKSNSTLPRALTLTLTPSISLCLPH